MSRVITTGGTVNLVPSTFDVGENLPISGNYPASNGYHDTSNSTYARFQPTRTANVTGYCYYGFTITDIPSGAVIDSVTCLVKVRSSNSSGLDIASIQMCAGETPKGNVYDFHTSTSTAVQTLSGGTWTRDEVLNLRLKIEGHRPSNSNRYVQFYGAELTIVWSLNYTEYEVTVSNTSTAVTTDPTGTTYVREGENQGILFYTSDISSADIQDNGAAITPSPSGSGTYSYTITNISADHTVTVSDITPSEVMYTKSNGSWTTMSKVYKKVNNVWVEQTDLTNVFEDGIVYINDD